MAGFGRNNICLRSDTYDRLKVLKESRGFSSYDELIGELVSVGGELV